MHAINVLLEYRYIYFLLTEVDFFGSTFKKVENFKTTTTFYKVEFQANTSTFYKVTKSSTFDNTIMFHKTVIVDFMPHSPFT